jgi:anti-anti-sigma regulatory factor
MSVTIKRNTVIVEVEDLDIYAAGSLKDALFGLLDKGKRKVSVDLAKVNRITTPAIQVLISAGKTFAEFNVSSVSESLAVELKRLGVEL